MKAVETFFASAHNIGESFGVYLFDGREWPKTLPLPL
jgi:hypothetical protein